MKVSDPRALVAIDLGAESCRVSLLRWLDGEPQITLVHRFANSPQQRGERLVWDLAMIEAGVLQGLRRAAEIATEGIRSIAADGWAVDYVRFGVDGAPLGDPFCYRDLRTVAAERDLHAKISPERMREITAIQPMRINTLYQLVADRRAEEAEGRWLNLPEYMLFRLGGRPVSEASNAAHTQLVAVEQRGWSEEIFQAAELKLAHAPRLVPSGTDLGPLTGPLAELPAYRETRLIAPACHDTAGAIAGIPALGDDWAYISSGTWSLVGTPVREPVRSAEAAAAGFTNFAAAGGLTCFHVNINGMWPLRQCMDAWERWPEPATAWPIEELIRAAEQLPQPQALLNVDEPSLLLPGEMMRRINEQLIAGGHAPHTEHPEEAPVYANLLFHSLAARYREVLTKVAHLTGKELKRVFVVGGGSRNKYLNRLLGEATGLEVRCGSPESSTIGNFAIQLAVLEAHANPGPDLIFPYAEMLARTEIVAG